MAQTEPDKKASPGILGVFAAWAVSGLAASYFVAYEFSQRNQFQPASAPAITTPTAVVEDPKYVKTRNQFEDLFRSGLDNPNKIQNNSSGYPVAFIEEPGRSWRLSSLEANIQTAYFSPKLTGYDPHALAGAFILMPDGIRIKAERERTVIWTQRPNGLETIAKDFDMSKADAERQVQDVREVLYSKLNKK